MKQINEKEFISYTIRIERNGCNLTLFSLQNALREYNDIGGATLFGNRANGTRAILDSK